MDIDVPSPIAQTIVRLKAALVAAADAGLACADTSADPALLQTKLAQLLHANPPEPPPNTVIKPDDHRFDEALGSYGTGLRVHITRPAAPVPLLQVELTFNIECGSDTILLLFSPDNGHWTDRLVWQAPPLKQVGDAFGDFFLSAILPGPTPGSWRAVVAHGRPWCSSRWSGFSLDLLEPQSKSVIPRVLWTKSDGYVRFEIEPTLKAAGDTFELRLEVGTIESDIMTRLGIYRYQELPTSPPRRISPIARDGRGFVDEWLQMSWDEAAAQTDPRALQSLHALHNTFNPKQDPNDNQFLSHIYGPVRACTTPKHFQVEIGATRETTIPGKPGGNSDPLPSTFFQIRETGNGYQMLSAANQPNPTCNGRDLMPPH